MFPVLLPPLWKNTVIYPGPAWTKLISIKSMWHVLKVTESVPKTGLMNCITMLKDKGNNG